MYITILRRWNEKMEEGHSFNSNAINISKIKASVFFSHECNSLLEQLLINPVNLKVIRFSQKEKCLKFNAISIDYTAVPTKPTNFNSFFYISWRCVFLHSLIKYLFRFLQNHITFAWMSFTTVEVPREKRNWCKLDKEMCDVSCEYTFADAITSFFAFTYSLFYKSFVTSWNSLNKILKKKELLMVYFTCHWNLIHCHSSRMSIFPS